MHAILPSRTNQFHNEEAWCRCGEPSTSHDLIVSADGRLIGGLGACLEFEAA
jgi:hypothetical protein